MKYGDKVIIIVCNKFKDGIIIKKTKTGSFIIKTKKRLYTRTPGQIVRKEETK